MRNEIPGCLVDIFANKGNVKLTCPDFRPKIKRKEKEISPSSVEAPLWKVIAYLVGASIVPSLSKDVRKWVEEIRINHPDEMIQVNKVLATRAMRLKRGAKK